MFSFFCDFFFLFVLCFGREVEERKLREEGEVGYCYGFFWRQRNGQLVSIYVFYTDYKDEGICVIVEKDLLVM